MEQERYLVVDYKNKIVLNVKAQNCKTRKCILCLQGNDCYSNYESAFLRHLKTKRVFWP